MKWLNNILHSLGIFFILSHVGASLVTLEDGGYENVLVSISPYVPASQSTQLIAEIKVMLNEASAVLFSASLNRVYFKSANILIPASWNHITVDSDQFNYTSKHSDIRVDVPNPIYGDQPYTVQNGKCGDPGEYIHINNEFLIDQKTSDVFGGKGKVLVHEWAKYRWGVFDEIGYPSDPTYPLFYYNLNDQEYYPTHCSGTPLKGENKDINTSGSCTLDAYGRPNNDCRFVPDLDQDTRSSLMSFTTLPTISQFCGSSASREHNPDAPTKHNVLCNRRSVWEVIRGHSDFSQRYKRDVTPEVPLPELPEIKVVRQSSAHYCLVLDYSKSMEDYNRIENLKATASNWLRHQVGEGSMVGVVKFAYTGWILRSLTDINNETRQDLINAVERSTITHSTCIGCGLRLAIQKVLNNRTNAVIVLITDGEENKSPKIKDVIPELIESQIKVISVSVGKEADPKLEELAELSNGESYYVSDDSDGTLLEDVFQNTLEFQPSEQIVNSILKIHQYNPPSTSPGNFCNNFTVDSTVGRDVNVNIRGLKSVDVELELRSENGKVYRTEEKVYTLAMAEIGKWEYCLKFDNPPSSVNYVVEVTSKPRSTKSPAITSRSWKNEKDGVVILYSQVSMGTYPIIRANVSANIDIVNSASQFTLPLLDNGQGADITANDGIYSRYLTNIQHTGRYSINIEVQSKEDTLIAYQDTVKQSRSKRSTSEENNVSGFVDYCCGMAIPVKEEYFKKSESFTRFSSAGTFQILNDSISVLDQTPPSRVTDLVVEEKEGKLVLNWTAPGDDFDQGIVSGYIIKKSFKYTDLYEESFKGHDDVLMELSDKTNVEIFQPGSSAISLELEYSQSIDAPLYIALTSYDDENIYSPVSTIGYVLPRVEVKTGMANWIILLIVIGVICGVLLVALIAIKILRIPKRFKAVNKDEESLEDE